MVIYTKKEKEDKIQDNTASQDKRKMHTYGKNHRK